MITYKKQINALNVKQQVGNSTNVVFSVAWDFVAEEDGFKASFPHLIEIPYVEGGNFVDYQNLTQEIIESWIDVNLSQEKLAEFQEASASSIAYQKQSSSPKLPWVQENSQQESQ